MPDDCEVSAYERSRLERMSRNGDIINQLQLQQLAASLGNAAAPPKPVRKRRAKEPATGQRRSKRVEHAAVPAGNSAEQESIEHAAAARNNSPQAKTQLAAVAASPSLPSTTKQRTADTVKRDGVRECESEFAQRVLSVIQCIPNGQVAAYGQVAALAGASRNAREVGRMLAQGLANGDYPAPWQRVINAAGRISLPPECGGNRQRSLLEAEGVIFKSNGAVQNDMFWVPANPDEFFVGWGR